MIENLKGTFAKLRERAVPIAEASLERTRRSAKSLCGYVRSVTDRMTVKERLLVLFAVGLVIGFGVKAAANGSITIGYQDYSLKGKGKPYDLNEVQRRVAAKAASVSAGEADPTTAPAGGSCQ